MLFNIPSIQMPNVDLEGVMRQLTETGKRTQQLWLTADSMAFIARGREYRSEFHINPSYEIQYSLRGDPQPALPDRAGRGEGRGRARRLVPVPATVRAAFAALRAGCVPARHRAAPRERRHRPVRLVLLRAATTSCTRRPTSSTTTAPIR